MGKGPLDARIEAIKMSRRALSNYMVQNAQKRNLKNGVLRFLPQILYVSTIFQKNEKSHEIEL